MHPIARRLFALALAAIALPSAASALTLDAFTNALPPNPCLPLSGQAVVFSGPYCDGVACSPDPWVNCPTDEVMQVGLSGVHAGAPRWVEAMQWDGSGTASARIDPATQRLHGVLDIPAEAGVLLGYGTPYAFTQDPDALNLDLVALGVVDLRFELDGTMSPQQPLLVAVELLADAAGSPRPSAAAVLLIDQPGTVVVPLAAFVPRMPAFTLSDVDDMQLWISNCPEYIEGCSGATFAPAAFSLGPIELVAGPTPATPRSWGSLKAVYR